MKGAVAVFTRLMRGILSGLLAVSFLIFTGCGGSDDVSKTGPPAGTPMADPNRQLELLADPKPEIRRMAAKNLGAMGAEAEVAVSALEEMANNDPDEKARAAASEALQKIRGAGN